MKIGGKVYKLSGAMPLPNGARLWSRDDTKQLAADVELGLRQRFNIDVPYDRQQRARIFNGKLHFGRKAT